MPPLDFETSTPATRALIACYDALDAGEGLDAWRERFAPGDDPLAAVRRLWPRCDSGTVLLALAERLAPRPAFLRAAVRCAAIALPARSTPHPDLARALGVASAVAAGALPPAEAKRASDLAYSAVSRCVAGVDDDVGLAVSEACDLAAGAPFEASGPNPVFRAAWALASARFEDREAIERYDRELEAAFANVVRELVPAEALEWRGGG